MSDKLKVVSLDTTKKQKQSQDEMLKILNALETRIKNGEIDEFVISSIDMEGNVQISVYIKDVLGGIGLFEIGKQSLISDG